MCRTKFGSKTFPQSVCAAKLWQSSNNTPQRLAWQQRRFENVSSSLVIVVIAAQRPTQTYPFTKLKQAVVSTWTELRNSWWCILQRVVCEL